MTLKKWIDSVLCLFFPQTCIVCGGRLAESEQHICVECNMKMPRTHDHLDPENVMTRMLWQHLEINRACAFFLYSKESNYKHILHQLKYHGSKDIGEYFGRLMATEIVGSHFFEGIDYLIPVPLHPKRYRSRGYNQSECIANGISSVTGIPIDISSVIRVVNTHTQTSKNAEQRSENMKDVFTCINPEIFRNKHILIIDDVFTTGATTISCAQSIQETIPLTVSILTMARAQRG